VPRRHRCCRLAPRSQPQHHPTDAEAAAPTPPTRPARPDPAGSRAAAKAGR
jgi:hypothetical protein